MNYSGLLFFTGQQLFHDILILAGGETTGVLLTTLARVLLAA